MPDSAEDTIVWWGYIYRYAVYVQTRLVNHPGARNAISKIHFVKTHFGIPEPPRMRESYAINSNKVKVIWDPPLNAYGVITHYTVTWTQVAESLSAFPTDHDACNRRVSASPHHTKNSATLSSSIAPLEAQQTCSREQGCCQCSEVNSRVERVDTSASSAPKEASKEYEQFEESVENKSAFEDTVQNKVFVQK